MGPSVSREMAVPPAAVWAVLTDVSTWPQWGPSVSGATLRDDSDPPGVVGAGARGMVRTAVGLSLPFEVTRFVPGRTWAWKVAGVPATAHHVRPTASGGCVVTFAVPWWAPGYLVVCALALPRIERLAAERGASS